MQKETIIFTDGCCEPNPGPGAWGAVILINGKVIEISGYQASTTNNRMELFAAIMALAKIHELSGPVTIYSDSQYVIQGITSWIHKWKQKNRWKNSEKKNVKNADLWQMLDQTCEARRTPIAWKHVRSHCGIIGNEMADDLAKTCLKVRPEKFIESQFLETDSLHDLRNLEMGQW